MKPTSPRFLNPTARLDRQVLALFDKMRIEDDRVRDWSRAVLASKNKDAQTGARAQRAELQRQETMIAAQQDRLLKLRIKDQIVGVTFNRKQTELRDRLASIMLQLEVLNRSRDENAEIMPKVFELSQTLRQRWLTTDYAEKRKILEII